MQCESWLKIVPSQRPDSKDQHFMNRNRNITLHLFFLNVNRRKESSEVNSLISALDTTLKFTEQRKSPELGQETQEEQIDDPGGKYNKKSLMLSIIFLEKTAQLHDI